MIDSGIGDLLCGVSCAQGTVNRLVSFICELNCKSAKLLLFTLLLTYGNTNKKTGQAIAGNFARNL